MLKVCVVCGKEFEARQINYLVCSLDCRKIRNKAFRERYEKSDKYREKVRQQCMKHYVVKNCEFCGKRLPNGKQKYCLDCLLDRYTNGDAYATHILTNRGYSTEEIWREIESRDR